MSVCRGCAGSGVSQAVSRREAQVAARKYVINPAPGRKGVTRWVLLGPEQPKVRDGGMIGIVLPLVPMLAVLDELARDEFQTDQVPYQRGWACEWCFGTGVPQLSAATLAMAVTGA